MAENNANEKEVLLRIKGDSSEATSELAKVQQQIDLATKKAIEMGRTDYGSMSVRELRDELQKAEQSMEQLESSGQATAGAMRVIGDRVGEISGALDGINRQKSFETFKGSIMASTGAVEALEGAVIALGIENEAFEESIQKIMGIRAFKDGLEDVFEYGESLKGLVIGTNGVVSATKVLKLALSGLGIGLLVTAVMYLVENWDSLYNSLGKSVPVVKNLGYIFENFKAILLTVGQTIVGAVLPVVKNMISAFSNAYSGIKQIFSGDITGGLKSLGKAFIDASPINHIKSFTTGLIDGVKSFKTNLNTNIEKLAEDDETKKKAKEGGKKVGKELAKGVSEGVKEEFENNVVSDELDKEYEKLLMLVIKNNADANRVIREANTEARQLALEDVREEYAEKIRLAEEAGLSTASLLEAQRIKEAEINKKYDDLELKQQQTLEQLRVDLMKAQNEGIDTSTPDGIKAKKEADRKVLLEQNAIDLQALKDQLESEAITIEEYNARVLLSKQKLTNDLDNLNKDQHNSVITWEEMTLKQKLEFIDKNLENVITAFGEASAVGKASAIAQTTIATYQSATESYKALSGIPVVGPALGAISAGLAVAAGLANVRKIMAVKADGKGSSAPTAGRGSYASASASAPTAPIINTTVLNRGATDDINSLGENSSKTTNAPIRAYIVDKDIEKSSQKNELTDKLSTF